MGQMYAMMLPVLPGKLEDWKAFAQNLLKDKRKDYEAARLKAGIQREMIWHQSTPLGDMLILMIEAEGKIEDVLAAMVDPQDEFNRYFMEQAKIYHGLDPENVKGASLNELVIDWTSPTLLEKASETAMGIGQNLAGTAQSLIGKAGVTATEVGQNVATNANSLAGRAQEMAQEGAAKFQQQAMETGQKLQQQANEAGEKFQQQAQEVKKQVEARTSEFLDKAGEQVAGVTHQMQAKAGEALENAAEVGQDIAEKASGLFHQALDFLHKKPEKPDAKTAELQTPKEEPGSAG